MSGFVDQAHPANNFPPRRKILSPGFSYAWPPNDNSGFVTVNGSNSIFGGPGTHTGNLRIANTGIALSSYTYHTSWPTGGVGSGTITMPAYIDNGNPQLYGIYFRVSGWTGGASGEIQNGYRFDYLITGGFANCSLRIIRFDGGVATVIGTTNITGTYYGLLINAGSQCTYNLTYSSISATCWLSQPGQADSPPLTVTGLAIAPYPSGRFGMVQYFNNGAPGVNDYRGFTA